MIKSNKNAFTLVELLAVIVILAIILVIAVPQIMNTIKDATKASFESSAKMVAAQVENQYTVAQTLNKEFLSTGSCMQEWAGLNGTDYESCTYKIESDGTAKVTIKGKGKFKDLKIIDATRSSATANDDDSSLDELGCDTLYWDGNTEGLEKIEVDSMGESLTYYRLCDYVETDFSQLGSVAALMDTPDGTVDQMLPLDESMMDVGANAGHGWSLCGGIVILSDGHFTARGSAGAVIPEGVWFVNSNVQGYRMIAKSLTINGYTGFPHSENCGH